MALSKKITAQIKEVLKKNPQGLSITNIVALVRINRNTAGRYLESLLVSGEVDMRQFGMAKIYTLSRRLPVSSILSISSERVMQLDNSLRIIFTNEPFLKLLEVTARDLLGKNIEYTVVPSVFDDIFPELLTHLKQGLSGTEWKGELALSGPGKVFFCRIAPTVFSDGQKGVSVLFEDITEHRRAEESLRESEERFRTVFEHNPLGIALVRQDFRFRTVNPRFCQMLGYSADQLLTLSFTDITHPDDLLRDVNQVKKFKTGELDIYKTEKRYLKEDGSLIWASVTVSPVMNEHHRVMYAIAMVEDITARKQAEEKPRRD